MAGIGQQGQRAGEDAPDDLGYHEAAGQQPGETDATLVRRVAMTVSMTMLAVVMAMIIVRVSVGVLHVDARAAW